MKNSGTGHAVLQVVETLDGELHLGLVSRMRNSITNDASTGLVLIRSGMRGHPVVLYAEEVASITPASRHPLVSLLPGDQPG